MNKPQKSDVKDPVDLRMTIRIPDKATNGDVLRLLFPSEDFEDKGYICQYPLDEMIHDFSSKWWNSSYKGDHEND